MCFELECLNFEWGNFTSAGKDVFNFNNIISKKSELHNDILSCCKFIVSNLWRISIFSKYGLITIHVFLKLFDHGVHYEAVFSSESFAPQKKSHYDGRKSVWNYPLKEYVL